MGFARVAFEFPESVRFPCLPVRVPNNLIFPRRGESYATASEIALAVSLGALITIMHGVTIPIDATTPFETVIRELQGKRKDADLRDDKLSAGLFKELGNSLYGKTAQGLREKRVFDNRSGDRRQMPQSRITNVVFAAYVTGLIRAALGEIMNALPQSVSVLSCTTDGFICNSKPDELGTACNGPVCGLLKACRGRLHGIQEIVEVKHKAAQVLVWRTRGQATIEPFDGGGVILAKASINIWPPIQDEKLLNWHFVNMFSTRRPGDKFEVSNLPSPLQLFKKGGDFVRQKHMQRLGMEFDFKRKPVHPRMMPYRSHAHLGFETQPWSAVLDYQSGRDLFDHFKPIFYSFEILFVCFTL